MHRLAGIEGCSDHKCVFGHPGGMGTNGGCACEREIRSPDVRRKIRKNARAYFERIEKLTVALYEIMAVITEDDLIPESVSYMQQAREALRGD